MRFEVKAYRDKGQLVSLRSTRCPRRSEPGSSKARLFGARVNAAAAGPALRSGHARFPLLLFSQELHVLLKPD
jgi:hypothetical protein